MAIDGRALWSLGQAVGQRVAISIRGIGIVGEDGAGSRRCSATQAFEACGGEDDIIKVFVAAAGEVFPLEGEFAVGVVAVAVFTGKAGFQVVKAIGVG